MSEDIPPLSCDTCRWADPTVLDSVDGEPAAVLLCRRHPPIPVADEAGVGPAWPLVHNTDWCAEHTPPVTTVIMAATTGLVVSRARPDRYGRMWQCQWRGCPQPVRAWTETGVLRRARRYRRRQRRDVLVSLGHKVSL